MTETNKKILECIDANMSLKNISSSLDLSYKQVYNRILALHNQGYILKKIVDNNGNLVFAKAHSTVSTEHIRVKIHENSNFKAALISDIHVGNIKQNLDYLNLIYEYCKENDIHTIINTGDLVDGHTSQSKPLIEDPFMQVETLIKNYPYDENILNIICLGDHDNRMNQYGIDVKKMIEHARYDLIPLGYGRGIINIGNEEIGLRHRIESLNYSDFKKMKLVINGHHHKLAFVTENHKVRIDVPSLSDLQFKDYEPGFMHMNLQLKKGLISSLNLKAFNIQGDKTNIAEEHFIKF